MTDALKTNKNCIKQNTDGTQVEPVIDASSKYNLPEGRLYCISYGNSIPKNVAKHFITATQA